MKNLTLACLSALVATWGAASAAVDIFVWDDSGDLRVQAEGTLDLTGTTPNVGGLFNEGVISIASGGIIGAVDGNELDRYDIAGNFPPSFGGGASLFGGVFTGTNSILTDRSIDAGVIWVSEGFQSGGTIFAAATAAGESLASISADVGVYVWTLPNDTVTFRIGESPVSAPVPVPPAMALFGMGALALYRKAKRA